MVGQVLFKMVYSVYHQRDIIVLCTTDPARVTGLWRDGSQF